MIYEHMPGGPIINLTSANKQVPDIELRIRFVKDRKRYIIHSLTLKNIPKLLTIYIVFNFSSMLNYFPVKGEVSTILSNNTILYSETIHYKQNLGIKIGNYLQLHNHEDSRNSQVPCTKGAILLGPIGNEQGGFLFMSLNSS